MPYTKEELEEYDERKSSTKAMTGLAAFLTLGVIAIAQHFGENKQTIEAKPVQKTNMAQILPAGAGVLKESGHADTATSLSFYDPYKKPQPK